MARTNQARDSQALNFGVQSITSGKAPQEAGALSATAAGPPPTATLVSARSATTNDLAGCTIVTTTTSATWSATNTIYATILSNTSGTNSVTTVDGWWKVSDNTAAGANPFATAQYVILPAQMPFWVMGLCSDTTTVTGSETGTSPGTELNATGLTRNICTTFTHSAGASTGTIGFTFTFTGSSSTTIGKSFLANSQTVSAGSGRGNFMFFLDVLNSTTGYVVASNGDTLQVTYTITYTTVP